LPFWTAKEQGYYLVSGQRESTMNEEHEGEIDNLIHLLQQTARMAFQLEWTGSGRSYNAA
jgi:hypothetical protein